MNTPTEQFFERAKKWNEEYHLLREIIRENSLLAEEFKWMHPCYTVNGKNVVLIHGFKEYCALLFHKGALLQDTYGLFIQQTENVQSARQIRFTAAEQIKKLSPVIREYIKEAIAIEKAGKSVELKKLADYPVPEEWQQALEEDEQLKNAFHALTQGRQKAYLVYFNAAKQSKTRQARIEKYYRHILAGKGIDDPVVHPAQ